MRKLSEIENKKTVERVAKFILEMVDDDFSLFVTYFSSV